MGLFSCRKSSWLGFNKEFRGFGGEEGYIHEKYRKNGKKALCLPFLRWLHRFGRPSGVPYTNDLKDRFRNYMIGFVELGLDTTELKNHFSGGLSEHDIESIEKESFSIKDQFDKIKKHDSNIKHIEHIQHIEHINDLYQNKIPN